MNNIYCLSFQKFSFLNPTQKPKIRRKYTDTNTVYIFNFHFLLQLLSLSYSSLALRSLEDTEPFQDQFPGVFILSYFSPAILFRSFSPSYNHLFLDIPTDFLPSAVFSHTFFTVLFSDVLSTCPNDHNLPFMIPEIIFGFPYRFINSSLVRTLHTPFSFTRPYTVLSVFLFQTAKVFSLLLFNVTFVL